MKEKYYYQFKKNLKVEISDIFNRRADTFDALPWVTNREFLGHIFKVIYEFLKNYRKDNIINRIRFLDVGTGTGEVLKYFLEEYPKQGILENAYAEGIDISEKMLKIANKKLSSFEKSQRVTISQQSIYQQDTRKESFDFIICRNSFHHFELIEESLEIMSKILRKNGIILIIEGIAPDQYTLLLWREVLELKDVGRNKNVYLSYDTVRQFFLKYTKNLNLKIIGPIMLTPVPMLVSQWLNNVPFSNKDTKMEEILKTIGRLCKKNDFAGRFGIKRIIKDPLEKQDFKIKKRSALIILKKMGK